MSATGDEGDFAAHLAAAVDRRGVTLSWLRQQLADAGSPVAISTLSSWRTGRRSPYGADSEVVVARLEELLDLPHRRLLGLMGEHHVRERVSKEPFAGLRHGSESMDAALAAIETPDDGSLSVLSMHVTAFVDDQGRIERIDNRQLVRANRDGVDRVPLVYHTPETADPALPERPPDGTRFEVVSGATVSRRFESDREGSYGLGLRLDPVLRSGETALIEVAFRPPPFREPEGVFEQLFTHGRQEGLVVVCFAAGCSPGSVETFVQVDQGEETVTPARLRGGVAHVAVSDFGPGVIGVRWIW